MSDSPEKQSLTSRRRLLAGLGGGLLASLAAALTRPWAHRAPVVAAPVPAAPFVPVTPTLAAQPPGDLVRPGDPFTREWFLPHAGSVFTAVGAAHELTLADVGPAVATSDDTRRWTSFSLVFHAKKDTRLPEETLEFHHPRLGSVAFYLNRIGNSKEPVMFEAIFSQRLA